MSYQSIVEMAGSQSLLQRIVAAAASEGRTEPLGWAQGSIWHVVSEPGWADAWDYAKDTATVNHNPDLGARNDVINDGMILAAVQAVMAEQTTPSE